MSKWYETYSHTLLLHYRSLFLVRIITIGLVCTFFKVICKYFNVLNVGVNVFFLLFKKKKKDFLYFDNRKKKLLVGLIKF
jgi:hypothetical protein